MYVSTSAQQALSLLAVTAEPNVSVDACLYASSLASETVVHICTQLAGIQSQHEQSRRKHSSLAPFPYFALCPTLNLPKHTLTHPKSHPLPTPAPIHMKALLQTGSAHTPRAATRPATSEAQQCCRSTVSHWAAPGCARWQGRQAAGCSCGHTAASCLWRYPPHD